LLTYQNNYENTKKVILILVANILMTMDETLFGNTSKQLKDSIFLDNIKIISFKVSMKIHRYSNRIKSEK